MKKFFIFVCLSAVTLFSCSSPEQKLIKNHINAHLPDVKSYESIELSEPKPYLSRLDENIELALFEYELDSLKRIEKHKNSDVVFFGKLDFNDKEYGQFLREMYTSAVIERMQVEEGIKSAKHQIDSISSNYSPVQLGYEVRHKFRAKNDNGGYALEEFYFVTDMDKLNLIKVYPKSSNINTDFPSLIYYDVLSLGM